MAYYARHLPRFQYLARQGMRLDPDIVAAAENYYKNIDKMEKEKSVFEVLNAVNCNEHTEKKNGLTYLSWAWAWGIVKSYYPGATYTIYESRDGLLYHSDGRTAWVKTGVTIEGLEYIEYLPVMDNRNNSIPVERLTSFDVNKAVQRSLTKACARHGLGLYIYAGEDLPENEAPARQKKSEPMLTEDEKENLDLAIQEIKEAKSLQELNDVAKRWSGFYTVAAFVQAGSKRKAELSKN